MKTTRSGFLMFEAIAYCLLFALLCFVLFSWVVVVQSRLNNLSGKCEEACSTASMMDVFHRDISGSPQLVSQWSQMGPTAIEWKTACDNKIRWELVGNNIVRSCTGPKNKQGKRKTGRGFACTGVEKVKFEAALDEDKKIVRGVSVGLEKLVGGKLVVTRGFAALRNRSV